MTKSRKYLLAIIGVLILGIGIISIAWFLSGGLFAKPEKIILKSFVNEHGFVATSYTLEGNATVMNSVHVEITDEYRYRNKLRSRLKLVVYTSYYRGEAIDIDWLSHDTLEIRSKIEVDPIKKLDSLVVDNQNTIFIKYE